MGKSLTGFGIDKGLGSNDVADAVAGEQDGRGELLLRGPGNVGRNHGQRHAEAEALEIAEPKSHETAPLMMKGQQYS